LRASKGTGLAKPGMVQGGKADAQLGRWNVSQRSEAEASVWSEGTEGNRREFSGLAPPHLSRPQRSRRAERMGGGRKVSPPNG